MNNDLIKKINLNHKNGAYKILIGENLFENIGSFIKSELNFKNKLKFAIISDDIVYNLYGEKVKQNLISENFEVKNFVFKNGESSKNLKTIENIYNFLSENKFNRNDCLIALGGGVVGDITGFAAATYLRGVKFIQVPTTLLAQVDSSVGGKTGVDLSAGKNLVGAFWQPELVLCDVNVLDTLSSKIYASGMAEIIKHACIKSADLFEKLEQKSINLVDMIYTNINIKAQVVMADEFEIGERAFLNFGHTIGHAIEKYFNFEKYSHGEAVSIGMVYAAKISHILGFCDKGVITKIENILKLYNLPINLSKNQAKIDYKILAEICTGDKKSESDCVKFILLKKIGDCFIERIANNKIQELLSKCEE